MWRDNLLLAALFSVSILIICGGSVMVAEYHADDVHTNGNGTIIARNCSMECVSGVTDRCSVSGMVLAQYQLNDAPGVWMEEWIPADLSYNGVCLTTQCCKWIMENNATVYFVIDEDDGNTITDFSLVADYNKDIMITFGVIFLIVGIPWFLVMVCAFFAPLPRKN